MRLYGDLSWLWSEVTPVGTYADEARDLFDIAAEALGRTPKSILELGAGGGYLLDDLQQQHPDVHLTLVDSSPEMLMEASLRNPVATTICADMTTLALTERFDVVFLHDAVMYLEGREAVSQVLSVMRNHVADDGIAIIVPDVCRETFEERILTAEATGDRAHVHFTEWHWENTRLKDRVSVEFAVLIKEHDQDKVLSHHETHTMLVLSLSDWMTAFMEHLWMQDFPSVPWMHGGEFFLLRPM